MNDFAAAFSTAFSLIGHFDPDLREIVTLSLEVSLTASVCALVERRLGVLWPSIASEAEAR
jgi:tungstate transport system permease protein